MMVKTNIDWSSMSDTAIMEYIGEYIRHRRLEQNISQAELAKGAGLNRWTIGQIERGESVTLNSLIRVLRILGSLHKLDVFRIEEQQISPLEYAKIKKKQRKQASPVTRKKSKEGGSEW